MTGNDKFLLEQLVVDEEYKTAGGNTEPSWVRGFFGTVHFRPWNGFKHIIERGLDDVERLSERDLSSAFSSLNNAREFIDKTKQKHSRLQNIQNQRLELLLSEVKEKWLSKSIVVDDKSIEANPKLKAEIQAIIQSAYIRKPVTNSTSLNRLHVHVMEALEKLICPMYPMEELDWEQRSLSSEYMRSYDNESGAGPVTLTQTPDLSLFRVTATDTGKIPVCTFEYKGPKLDLSGLTTVSFKNPDCSGSHQGSTQNTVEVDGDEDDSEMEDEGVDDVEMYEEGFSAQKVAEHFNKVFSDIQHLNTSIRRFGAVRNVLFPVGQAICQALLSKTGCGMLYNHQTAYAFRARLPKKGDRAIVWVTGAIPCNKVPGNFAAMVGFTKYCLDMVIRNDDKVR